MPTSKEQLLIIGAGPAGLALSHLYKGQSRLLEQSHEVGGLCRSMEFAGAVFDIGGHSFHSPHAQVSELVEGLMRGRWSTQRRDARVFFNGQLIDYPFQQHLEQISDLKIAAECKSSLPHPDAPVSATNFEEWILARFGAGVAKHFMLPYNRKLWARDLRRMSCEWVGERIAHSDPGKKHEGPARAPLRRDNEVSYPATGGFVEIYREMARQSGPVEFGQRVVNIDPVGKTVRTASGQSWNWQRLVSTMPIPALLRALEGTPAELIADADRLEFLSLKVLMLAIGQKLRDEPQRVYVSDPEVPAHKIAFNHTSSPSLRERPSHGIMCEIAYSPEKQPAPDAELARGMIEWLVDAGLIASARDVIESRVVDVPYGYPVYTHSRPAILERIERYLAGHNICTIGRFGHWDYVNSDGCIWQAFRLAKQLS